MVPLAFNGKVLKESVPYFNSYPHCFITKVVNEVKNDFN